MDHRSLVQLLAAQIGFLAVIDAFGIYSVIQKNVVDNLDIPVAILGINFFGSVTMLLCIFAAWLTRESLTKENFG